MAHAVDVHSLSLCFAKIGGARENNLKERKGKRIKKERAEVREDEKKIAMSRRRGNKIEETKRRRSAGSFERKRKHNLA